METKALIDLNPWWDLGEVPLKLRKETRRWAFGELKGLMSTRQILSVVGLRRVGKTTLLYQLIQDLIGSGVEPGNILYFSFDIAVDDVRSLLDSYQDISPEAVQGKRYVFLDEIQKLDNWTNQLKVIYDSDPDVKFVISGSASLEISHGGGESLAGRILKTRVEPLKFGEYLALSGSGMGMLEGDSLERAHKEHQIRQKEYLAAFRKAIVFGGFIETMDMTREVLGYYMRSGLVDNILMKDIPDRYPIDNPAVLGEILRAMSNQPGIIINYERLGSSLGLTRQTMTKYIQYLEDSFLVHTLYNYSGTFITSARKTKKAYLAHPSLASAFIEGELPPELYGRMAENYIVAHGREEFFYRRNGDEVDIVRRHGSGPIPIEVKYSDTVDARTVKVMEAFMERYHGPFGIIITKDIFGRRGNILLLPATLFLLLSEPLELVGEYMTGRP